MKRTILVSLILAVIFAMQSGVSVTYAAVVPGPVLLDTRDGAYLMRIINLTGEQLAISVTQDTSNSQFPPTSFSSPPKFPASALYSQGMNQGSTAMSTQQNIYSPTPIKLDTMLAHNPNRTYKYAAGSALPFWEGMINLTPLIPASNMNATYETYSGHFNQAQRLTITTVNNTSSFLNNAYIELGYNYTTKNSIIWKNVFDFAFSTIKNAADIAAACEDGDGVGGLKAGASELGLVAKAMQTQPVTASLTSAATLTDEPTTSQTSYFTDTTVTNYAQAMAYFNAANGGGTQITDSSQNNQLYTLASSKQVVVTLTASDNSVRYFTAPAYYIYIKNVEANAPGDINQCTIAMVDGWVYNLAVGMYQYTQPVANGGKGGNLAALQGLNPLQLMYYAGSSVQPLQPVPASSYSAAPAVNINMVQSQTAQPVNITNVTLTNIGG